MYIYVYIYIHTYIHMYIYKGVVVCSGHEELVIFYSEPGHFRQYI